MITTEEPLGEKDCLEFIDIFNSMISTCEKMKATIKRIQRSSNKSPFEEINKTDELTFKPSETSTCLTI